MSLSRKVTGGTPVLYDRPPISKGVTTAGASVLVRLRPAHSASRGGTLGWGNLASLTFAAFLPGSRELDSGSKILYPLAAMRENYGQMADVGIARTSYWVGVFPVRLDFSRAVDANRQGS